MPVAIKVENLSKAYQLGEIGTGSLSRDLERWFAKVRGKEDPFLKIGETNDRATKGTSNVVWSLKDINFEIQQGDAVGIIGRNGAGKSTLLKILSRITAPTTGTIKSKGRIASLLEVGTGFHPELSGRDNIFLNGAILGMRKKEIARKFDEILDFAGVERYIDTPVKRYSSGMYVRLAFAVAAHLESEILIVDEVLAVGDAEFQKKCLGKMNEVSKGEGRTVLFVSHQMGAVSQLCRQGLLISNGILKMYDETKKVLDNYLTQNNSNGDGYFRTDGCPDKDCFFLKIKTVKTDGAFVKEYAFHESINLSIEIKVNRLSSNYYIGIGLQDKMKGRISTIIKGIDSLSSQHKGVLNLLLTLPSSLIAPNSYSFDCAIFDYVTNKNIDFVETACSIIIHDTGTELAKYEGISYGSIIISPDWKVI
ncbi:polysaccharide ABC transporter ATP-binding protein [Segetibacter koreensis]|uniref:ABC transporter ATP-binding protein n=1 Tax=Segetibacter koreensis TaxID=398037 RepID=UPI000375D91C|nr:polysaccharide ABC transporter ATP-binding protein [Segetibacter koreensis]